MGLCIRHLQTEMKSIFLLALLSCQDIHAGNTKEDIGLFFNYLFHGSYLQFTQSENLYSAAGGVPFLWYSFEHDKRISSHLKNKNIPSLVRFIGQDLQIIGGLPLIPALFYYRGRHLDNDHHVQFALEYSAAMYLVYIETMLISFIPVHRRPSKEGLSRWETAFRGNSSFPSGHIVPFAVLTFKTWEFYNPWWSLIPASLTLMGSWQRVADQKHFPSDIIATLMLCAWASQGISAAASKKSLSSKRITMGLVRYEDTYGPQVTWNF